MITTRSKTPEKLLMGLAFGLAASLCALEYGKPLIARHVYTGAFDEDELFIAELPPITFPKPPNREQAIVERKPIVTEMTIVEELPLETPVDEIVELPDFEFDDQLFFGSGELAETPEIELNIPFVLVEKKPEFDDLEGYLRRNLYYPQRMLDLGKEGIVGVQFTIGADGSVIPESIEILRSPHKDFEKEVVRVIKKMPKWTPGEQRGKKVAVTHRLPIRFYIQ
ncbi:MAG: energy transducer TonB [Flavobacteriales bacterium]